MATMELGPVQTFWRPQAKFQIRVFDHSILNKINIYKILFFLLIIDHTCILVLAEFVNLSKKKKL